jgi:signal transduction histidine kinase
VALENSLIQRSLQQQVEQRSAELRDAYQRETRNEEQRRRLLEQKLKTSLTAAAVVHEIQQPLSSILLNCRLASRSLEQVPAERLPAGLSASLSQLSHDGDQVVATMERIRMLLRNVETEHGPLDLCASVDSALLFLKRDLAHQDLEPHLQGFGHPCPIRGDGAQLQIAVVNLIRNALQAMQSRSPAGRRLLLELRRHSEQLELVVADSGPGFPEGFSGDTSWALLQSTKATGMGIGLFLAQTAATNHRGQLCLGRSASLGGAEVRLILPLA